MVTTVNDTRQLLRETRDRVVPPSDVLGALERRRRHDTQVRRATAAVLGIIVALAGLGGWFAVRGDDSERTANPTEELGIFAPVAGWIFYANDAYGSARIRAVDPASSGEYPTTMQVTSRIGTPLGWSSDGTELLMKRFLEQPVNEQQLIILHADGTETEVVRRPGIGGAAISPDGSRVVYMNYGDEGDGEPRGLYLVDADGGPSVLLAGASRAIRDEPTFSVLDDPVFSPDGTQIAYVQEVGEWPQLENRVWIVNADGTDPHVIVENEAVLGPGLVVGLAWSPAGDRIAMGLLRDSGSGKYYYDPLGKAGVDAGIYTFSPNGSRFTLAIEGGLRPTWSPDGSRIAFEGLGRGEAAKALAETGVQPSSVMIADADGSDKQDLHLPSVGPGVWHPGPYRFAVRET